MAVSQKLSCRLYVNIETATKLLTFEAAALSLAANCQRQAVVLYSLRHSRIDVGCGVLYAARCGSFVAAFVSSTHSVDRNHGHAFLGAIFTSREQVRYVLVWQDYGVRVL